MTVVLFFLASLSLSLSHLTQVHMHAHTPTHMQHTASLSPALSSFKALVSM